MSSIFSVGSHQKKLTLLLINHSTFLNNNTNFLKDQKDKEDVIIEETIEVIIEEVITEEQIIEDHKEEMIEGMTEDKTEEMIEESKEESPELTELKIVETIKELTIKETLLPNKEDTTTIDLLVVTMTVKINDTPNNAVTIVQTTTIERTVISVISVRTVQPVVNTTEISIVSVKTTVPVNNNKDTFLVNNSETNVLPLNGQKSNKSVQETID